MSSGTSNTMYTRKTVDCSAFYDITLFSIQAKRCVLALNLGVLYSRLQNSVIFCVIQAKKPRSSFALASLRLIKYAKNYAILQATLI